MPFLFSYGTLQKADVQQALFKRLLHGTRDVLEGYRLQEVNITDKNFLATGEESGQMTVWFTGDFADKINGKTFEVSEEELRLADSYEPSNYRRKLVLLASGKQAWVYVALT